MHEKIIILDFGSQTTQLIGRRLRELNVYCEIVPYNRFPADDANVKGVILSGSPCSVHDCPDMNFLRDKYPVLEITVYDTKDGTLLLDNFLTMCGINKDWTPASFIEGTVEMLKQQLGDDKVILALSGGVDSSVTAALLNRAIGKNLSCIFVDHGLLRKNEFETVLRDYEHLGLNVKGIDARERFYRQLAGVSDPEDRKSVV